MNQLNSALTLFMSLLVEAMPFLLLGVAFSSILKLFINERRLVEAMPKNPLMGALAGSLVGFLFPVCECGNVPVARRLLVQGAPSSVAIGFLLAAPTVNPIVFWATWIAFRDQPEMVFLRIGLSLLIAVLVAWIFSFQDDLRPFMQPNVAKMMPERERATAKPRSSAGQSTSPLLQSGTFLIGQPGEPIPFNPATAETLAANPALSLPMFQRLSLLVDNMVQELRELGGALVIGAAIASVVQVAMPREIILGLGQSTVLSILAMMILAWVVSICSTVDSFFALSFASTFTSASLLAFLVFGPMVDVKNIGLLLTVFRWRAIFYLFALAGLLTFLFTLLLSSYIS
ncbi:MAG: permease [Thainema sp.]